MTFPAAPHAWKVALAVALGSGTVGCSLAFVNGPPPNAEKVAFFDCTSSNALPTIDLLFAGAAAIDAIGGSAGASGLPSDKAELASFALEGAVFAASAIYGYGKTSDCRKAQADMLKRASSMPTFGGQPGYPAGFAPSAPVPYDPWVAPKSPAPPELSPVGPLPASPAPVPVPAPGSGPGTNSDPSRQGKPVL